GYPDGVKGGDDLARSLTHADCLLAAAARVDTRDGSVAAVRDPHCRLVHRDAARAPADRKGLGCLDHPRIEFRQPAVGAGRVPAGVWAERDGDTRGEGPGADGSGSELEPRYGIQLRHPGRAGQPDRAVTDGERYGVQAARELLCLPRVRVDAPDASAGGV